MEVAAATSPPEEAALFNPAFLSVLIAVAAADYEKTARRPMPVTLGFLVAPFALHADTRAALPGNVRRRLSSWLIEHPIIQVGFPSRARATVPLVRDALRYGLRAGALEVADGAIRARIGARAGDQLTTADARDCARAAAFAGRWFARTGDPATLFTLWGVQP